MPPWLRLLFQLFGAIVLAVLVLVAGAVAIVHSPPGERLLAEAAEQALAAPGRRVAIDELRVGWPFVLSAEAVRVADTEGDWLRVRRPYLDWNPGRLWRKVVDIDRLAVEQVEVMRLPERPPGPAEPFRLPMIEAKLPFTLKLQTLNVPIVLDPAVAGERVAVELAGSANVERGGGVVDLHLRSDGGALARVAGTAGRDFLDLRWYLRVPRLARWQRLAGTALEGELNANGFLAGRLPQPVISAMIDLRGGRVGPLAWQGLTGEVRAIPDKAMWRLSLSAGLQAPRLDGASPLVPVADLAVAGELEPATGAIRLGRARLAAAGAEFDGFGLLEEWGRRSHLVVRAEAPRLEALNGLLGVRLKGHGRATLHLAGDLLAPRLDAVAAFRAQGFSSGVAVFDRLLGPAPTGRAALVLGPRAVAVQGARLRGAKGSVWAMGRVGGEVGLWTVLQVADLGVFTKQLAGAAVARGRLAGPLGRPRVWGVAESEGFQVAKLPRAGGAASFEFTLADPPAGQVAADLSMAGRPLTGSAQVVAAEPVRIDRLALAWAGTAVEGDLAVDRGGGVGGRLAVRASDLSPWSQMAGLPLAGSAEGVAELNPRQRQSAQLSLEARDLRLGPTRIARATAEANVSSLDATPTGTAAVEATALERGGITLSRATARLEGGLPQVGGSGFRFDVDAEGTPGQPAGLAAGGSARLPAGGGEARFERLRLAYAGEEARLAAPTELSWGRGGVRLSPAALALRDGRLRVAGGIDGERLQATLELERLPLALAELASPGLDTVGRVSGSATVGGTLARPKVAVNLTGEDVGFATAARAGIGRLAASVVGRWRDGRASGSLNARDGERLALRAEGSFPLTAAGIPADGPIAGELRLTGDLGRLTDPLPLAGHVFAGRVKAEATVGGTLAAPRVDGNAVLRDGRYENLTQGTIVADLAAAAEVEGQSVRLEAAGGDGGDGRVRLRGTGDLAQRSYRAEVTMTDFRALRRDDANGVVSGEFALAGQGAEARLTGGGAVDRAEIDLARLKGSAAGSLPVIEINKPGAPTPAPPAPRAARAAGEAGGGGAAEAVALDLAFDIRRAFVRGRGLQSEWNGHLQITGTADDPRLVGQMTAERGDYDFLGRSFRLTRDSTVTFTGAEHIDPELAVTAEARARDILARVELRGSVDKPDLDFTSDPPLPRDEVLSRVLFGSGTGGLSAFQQVQLGRLAATGLTGEQDAGLDPLGKLRGALGLDVLDVGSAQGKSGEAGGPTLSAGKYIGTDTFLRVEQGTEGLGRVTVEQELGGGFSVETSVGQNAGGGLGLNWRKDY